MRPRIAIVGANFAGLKAAQSLPRRYEVTVIDQSPWFEWLPNIHEIVSGVKRPSDLRLPRRRVVASAGHRFLKAKAVAIDAGAGRLQFADGRNLSFELCIVAVGGLHHNSAVPGGDRFALPFKSVEQCAAIGRRLSRLARGRASLSIVIVGGGLEGIEALGEIVRRYRKRRGISITVVDRAKRLLPSAPASLDRMIRRDCENLPVRFALGSPVAEIRKRTIRLRSGETLPFDLCIWSGGATPPPLLYDSGLAEAPEKWAKVRQTLQSSRFDNVLLAGDAAELKPALSKQAFYALQMGEHVAGNADRLLSGKELLKFEPAVKPMLVTFGDIDTFLVSSETALAGTALAAVKEAIYQLTMAQLDPPTSVSGLGSLGARLNHGLANTLPSLMSPNRLLRLPLVRVV